MSSLPKKHILFVDDEEGIVNILQEIVEFEVKDRFELQSHSAGDGFEALTLLATQKFDMVFIDLQMPNVNGDKVIKTTRSSKGPNQDIPFIILSGYLDQLVVDVSEQFEGVYTAQKPFSPEKISRMVKLFCQA